MKKIACILFVIAGFLNWGCQPMKVSTIPLSTYESQPPLYPDQVKVYMLEKDVPDEFVKMALIYAEEGDLSKSTETMVDKMRKKAAKIGANGLILIDMEDNLHLSAGEKGSTVVSDVKRFKALAILLKSE